MDNFGLMPLMAEGRAYHPDNYGIGSSDKQYLRQLKAYADWRGVSQTKKESCSRPHLLDLL